MYWYTRTSLVGIDVWATTSLAFAGLLGIICPPVFNKDGAFADPSGPMRVLYAIIGVWFALPALLMLRAILPVTITWTTWTNLEIQRAQATHRERASQRVANQITLPVRTMVCRYDAEWVMLRSFQRHRQTILALSATRYVISHFRLNRYLISPIASNPSHESGNLEVALFDLTFGLQLSGNLFQILMNRKSSTFAGRYRVAEILSASLSLLWVVRLSTHVVGKRNPTYSLTMLDCLDLIVELVKAYQAFVFPRVEQEAADEETY